MTAIVTNALLVLAALSLGLRTTSLLIPRVHPMARLLASTMVGAMFVAATLQISGQYQVYDMGLGLLLSLSPVGVFDLVKWRYRWGK
ncbi:MAG TPA: hypothetical protein VEA16_05425 [Vicinamibacterales bacterium]|nr:hypothetical protein [Vicinamibacterales bacterium]